MNALPQDSPPDPSRIDPRVWKIAAVVLLGPFMTGLDSTVVNVALATLSRELHASIGTIQWVTSGYLLSLALMLPLSGWLVDRFGAKRIYIVCFTAFTASSVLCGAAHSSAMLIAFRVLQGATGGLLAPMTQMMLARVAGRHLPRVMSLSGMPILLAPVVGPVIAGSILQHASWRWLFFLNLPVGVLAVVMAAAMLPRDDEAIRPRKFDMVGFLLLGPGTALFLSGLDSAGTSWGRLSLIVAVGLLTTFYFHAVRLGEAAIIDIALFRERVFSASAATQFLVNGMMFAGQVLIPLYLITGCHLSTGQTGWLFAALGLGIFCALPFVGSLTDNFGCRRVSAGGAALSLAGTIPFVWMAARGVSPSWVCVGLFLRGAGLGTIGIPSISAAYASVPPEKLAIATTSLNIVQRVGGPVATTLLALFLDVSAHGGQHLQHSAFAGAFWLLIGLHTLALAATFRLPMVFAHRDTNPGSSSFQAAEGLAD